VQIAVLTFDGFNELDSFVAAAILNRLRGQGWEAHDAAGYLDERRDDRTAAAARFRGQG